MLSEGDFNRLNEVYVLRTPLTPRQKDVLQCMIRGMTTLQAATELGLSQGTIKVHISTLLQKFGAKNKTDLVSKVMQPLR